MPSATTSGDNQPQSGAPRVIVTLAGDDSPREYDMFSVKRLDGRGAVLEGPLLLEVGEALSVRIETGQPALAVEAVVSSVRLEEQAMDISFVNLGSDEQRALSDYASKLRGR